MYTIKIVRALETEDMFPNEITIDADEYHINGNVIHIYKDTEGKRKETEIHAFVSVYINSAQ